MPNLAFALLIADTPAPSIVSKFGDYNKLFTDLLTRAASDYSNHSPETIVTVTTKAFDVVNKQEYPERLDGVFDAILITGSAASAYDDKPWINRLVEYVVQASQTSPKVKIVGICFGHQIVARAFGGRVEKNPLGWECGWTDTSLTEEGKKLFQTDKCSMRIQSMHQDHVVELPPDFTVLASTTISPNQAMFRKGQDGSPVLSIQGHPEYSPGIVTEIMKIRKERGVFTEEFVERVMKKVESENDGCWFTEKVFDFLLGRL